MSEINGWNIMVCNRSTLTSITDITLKHCKHNILYSTKIYQKTKTEFEALFDAIYCGSWKLKDIPYKKGDESIIILIENDQINQEISMQIQP